MSVPFALFQQRPVDLLTWIQPANPLLLGVTAPPFIPSDFPNPRGPQFPVENRTFISSAYPGNFPVFGTPAVPGDFPNPLVRPFPVDGLTFVSSAYPTRIPPIPGTPTVPIDYQNPRGYQFPTECLTFITSAGPGNFPAPAADVGTQRLYPVSLTVIDGLVQDVQYDVLVLADMPPEVTSLAAGGVASFNGRTGAVTLTSADVSAVAVASFNGRTGAVTLGAADLSGLAVTSVAVTGGTLFTVTGSPITGAGTVNVDLAAAAANSILAGPTSGAAAAPTFRPVAVADIPTAALPQYAVMSRPVWLTASAGSTSNSSGQCYAQYLGAAPVALATLSIRVKVTTLFTTGGVGPWAEVAIYKGTPALNGAVSYTRLGSLDVSGTFNATGTFNVTVTLSGTAVGDQIWLCWGSKGTTPYQLLGAAAEPLQSGYFQTFSGQPSVTASPTGGVAGTSTVPAVLDWTYT